MIHVKALLRLVILSFVLYSCAKKESQEIKPSQQVADEYDVSLELASKVAKNFSNDEAFLRHAPKESTPVAARIEGTEAEKEIKKVVTYTDDNGNPAMYIVNLEPEGFILVSATKKEVPILAYSDKGHFEINKDTLAGVKEWLVDRKNQIQTLKTDKNIIVPKQTQDLWAASAPPTDGEVVVSGGFVKLTVGPLLATKWAQGCGYNNLLQTCSTGNDCGKVVTGCVATAISQVMYYWKKPISYNWAIMPLKVPYEPANFDKPPIYEVSKLMKDVGTLVGMNYGCLASGAPLANVTSVFNYFGYSPAIQLLPLDYETVVNQLDNKRPVLLYGANSSNTTAHLWVTDGYQRNQLISIHNPGTIYEYQTTTLTPLYYYMNWGWSGNLDALYLCTNFTTVNNTVSPYAYNRKMIINIKP